MLHCGRDPDDMLRMFYFSGTGNARHVARWVVESWRGRGQPAEAIDIAGLDARTIELRGGDEVGLASPTHGFNFPPITLAFIFAFPRTACRNRIFIFNTRGGVRLFGIYVPGLSGVAQLLAALVFAFKGYRVAGMRPIDLPSSWISLHPGLRDDTIRAIYARCETITRRCANRLLDGRHDLRALFDLPQDLLIAPISLGYYLVGRFFFAKSFFASAACDVCGACLKECPVQAIHLVAGRPFWSHRCESCMRCMNHCPKRAVETAHGFVAGFVLVFELVMAFAIHPALASAISVVPGAGLVAAVPPIVLKSALMLAALFLSYRLFHHALRFAPVERLAVLTSLTHFRFWRRYRPPR